MNNLFVFLVLYQNQIEINVHIPLFNQVVCYDLFSSLFISLYF